MGKGVPQDLKEAGKWYQKAANNGCAEAQYILGTWYEKGNEDVAKDKVRTKELYLKAAKQKYAKAELAYAICQEEDALWKSAENWYGNALSNEDASNEIVAEAQYRMGRLYEEVKKDRIMSEIYYIKASSAGHVEAQYRLGMWFKNGASVPDKYDKEQEVKCFAKAAKQGHPEAEYWYGNCLLYGVGVPKDTKEGFNWYLASANHGVASAMNGVGFCYETGCGTAKSMTSAALWYQKAAEKGHSRGLYHLGDCYKNVCKVEKKKKNQFESNQK